MNLNQSLYSTRFSKQEIEKKQTLWRYLATVYFARIIPASSSVLEVGAGNCEFLNYLSAKTRVALDPNPDTKSYAGKGVKVVIGTLRDLPASSHESFDTIVMSNFLEHLPDKFALLDVLHRAHQLLKQGGQLLIIQPNISLAKEHYWDHIDHHIALNELSLQEAVVSQGYQVTTLVKRFLPLTVQSRLPSHSWLIALYLALPEWLRPFAGQSLLIAKKNKNL